MEEHSRGWWRRASGGALLLGVLLAGASGRAQDEPPPQRPGAPWWDAPAAREQANRVLDEVLRIVRAAERGDGRPALAALDHRAWVLRRVGATYLGSLGLDAEATARLLAAARPGRAPLPADDPGRQRARGLVEAREVEALPVPTLERAVALRIVTEEVQATLRHVPLTAPERRRVLLELLSYRAVLPKPEDRASLAQRLLELTERDQVRRDLGAAGDAEAVGRDGERVFRWVAENGRFVSYDEARGRFVVDLEARRAGRPLEVAPEVGQ